MTIEEMRSVLIAFCARQNGCSGCLIYKHLDECNWNDIAVINKAYDILTVAQCDESVSDNVNHPAHYQGKHECIDEMIALFGVDAVRAFCMCNVYKYRFRAAQKNGAEDLAKADWYMDKLMELNGYGKSN